MHTKLQNPRLLDGRQILALVTAVLIFCAIIGGLVFDRRAEAATASTINFQARLMNADGSIAPDGNYNIEFKLYTAAAADAGETPLQGACTTNPGAAVDEDCVWVETRTGGNVVTVANGYVTVNLGSVTAFSTSIDWSKDMWLTMNVGGTGTPSWDGEMTPRLKLTAVPYAFSASVLSKTVTTKEVSLQFAGSFAQDSLITLPDPGAGTATVCYQNSSSCGFATGSAGSYIQNGTTVQTGANFNIRSNAVGSVAGVLQGASGQTADLFDVQTWNGSVATTVFGVSNVGDLTVQNVNVAANKSITLASGTGTYTQTYANNTGTAATFNVTDNATSGTTTVQGVAINLTGTNNGTGTNDISGLAFGNVAAATNNAYHGIDFGTGYTDLLRYNGAALISGTGIVQSAAISGSYTNLTGVGTLTSGALGSGFTTVAVGQGGTGATSFTSNGVLYGGGTGALQVTAAGATGECLVGNTSAAPSWAACNTNVTLQDAYNNSTDPELTLGSAATAGITIRDNATPISGNLFEIQNNARTTTYLGVTSSAVTLGSGVDLLMQGASAYISNPQNNFANSEAFGLNANISGANGSTAVGNSATSTGSRSIAMGYLATTGSIDDAIAIGYQATVGSNGGIAIGTGTTAGFGSIALGYGATTTTNNQLVIGDDSSEITQVVIGSGVTDTTPNSVTIQSTGGSGANVAGASITIAGGQGTGTAAGGNIVLQTASAGASGSSLNGLVTRATFDTNNGLYLGNGLTAAAPNNFTINGTASTTTAVAGGSLTIQGGNATVGNANGGNITLTGGTGFGSGVRGLVVIDTPTLTTTTNDANCYTGGALVASSCTIDAASVNNSGAIIVGFNATGKIATVPDPTILTAGRILYITAANGSSDFTLRYNTSTTPIDIAMRANNTATLIWNGSDWTAAGASSSTDLQSAYNNTLTSAGGAEIVLNPSGGSADGLTIRNNATTPIIGGILEVQNSIGSNLLTVNNNATEYATNGGAETIGASASTFPSNTWDTTTGGTVDRWTTAGANIATGQASVRVQTTTTNHGARNRISASLTSGLTYAVSFAVRGTANFNTLQVLYSPDGTTTGTTQCATAQVVTSGIWTRITCSFIASGTITSSNSILIRQTDATARTFYIDNLSINVSASATYAADGSVDDVANFATNWTNYQPSGTSTVSRETATIFDTSGSAKAVLTGTSGIGLRNNLTITPQVNTQYLVSFYMRASVAMSGSVSVGFLPAGGTGAPSGTAACTDYNTQSLSADTWTEITCLFTTEATTITNADLVVYQSDTTARTIYVDALSITLNTNNSNNVQVGGANKGGPTTLFTLDRASTAPIAANNDAYLGSMYYDTTTGRIQCYEADGWGACGAAPDNIVNLNPEYAGAVLNGGGIGTMTADFCSNDTALQVNTTLCSTGQAKNFYKWTSPQATQQTYSIYVTYQLPATFNGFSSDDTVQLVGRVDNTSNASITYEMYKSTGSTVTQCGSGETNVITGGGGSANTWYSYGISGNESTGCSFSSSSAGNFVIFKINLKAQSNASAYVSTLSFTTTGR